MKTKLIFFGMLCFNLSFGQSNFNQSVAPLENSIFNPIAPFNAAEIFRFRSGLVSQLDAGNNFDLTPTSPLNSRWFSIGGINTGGAAPNIRRAYGLRFQVQNRAITMGYQNANDTLNLNPRIEWIHKGLTNNAKNNLEFRAANSFNSTISKLVATMTKDGTTFFGTTTDNPNTVGLFPGVVNVRNSEFLVSMTVANTFVRDRGVGLEVKQTDCTDRNTGIRINTGGSTPVFAGNNVGLTSNATFGSRAIGVDGNASGASVEQIGVRGIASGDGFFGSGVYGQAPMNFNQFAGFFDGDVVITGSFPNPSDRKLKTDIKFETNALDRIKLLKPVTYNYNNIKEINLANGLQHGFIAQDVAEVFPELTKDITKPIFDKDDNLLSKFTFKSLNYTGLISVLTAGMQELTAKIETLEKALAEKDPKTFGRNAIGSQPDAKGSFMEQNIPNPFADQTTINYQLPSGTNTAEIMVFDLNGRLIKSFAINKNQSEVTIKASEIGSGIFIYSLVQNGQELITKKMIVK